MPKTNYLRAKVQNHILGVQAYTMPTAVYLVFSRTDIGADQLGLNEPAAANGYSRPAITWNLVPNTGGTSATQATLQVGPCTGANWGTIVCVGVADSATVGGGNILLYASISPTVTININGAIVIDPGQLTEIEQ